MYSNSFYYQYISTHSFQHNKKIAKAVNKDPVEIADNEASPEYAPSILSKKVEETGFLRV